MKKVRAKPCLKRTKIASKDFEKKEKNCVQKFLTKYSTGNPPTTRFCSDMAREIAETRYFYNSIKRFLFNTFSKLYSTLCVHLCINGEPQRKLND